MNSNADAAPTAKRLSYKMFYRTVFLVEHQSPITVATHIVGTLLGLLWLAALLYLKIHWALIAFPVVHALPGLIGHRLAERNADVGDIRITRKDFPLWWFIVANHQLTWDRIVLRKTKA